MSPPRRKEAEASSWESKICSNLSHCGHELPFIQVRGEEPQMMATNNSAKRIYVPPFAARPEPSLFLVRRRRRLGRIHCLAVVLVVGWFALLLVALSSEMAVVAAVQNAVNRATFLHNSPPGHDGKPFRW